MLKYHITPEAYTALTAFQRKMLPILLNYIYKVTGKLIDLAQKKKKGIAKRPTNVQHFLGGDILLFLS